MLYEDGHLELENLSEEKNRDLMTTVIGDVMPKFKSLTQPAETENRKPHKMFSSVTKEIQKSSDALSAAITAEQ